MELYGLSPDDSGMRLSARVQRQRAVSGTPYTAYLGEPALRTVVGDKRSWPPSFAALLHREDITVRVVPAKATAECGQSRTFRPLA